MENRNQQILDLVKNHLRNCSSRSQCSICNKLKLRIWICKNKLLAYLLYMNNKKKYRIFKSYIKDLYESNDKFTFHRFNSFNPLLTHRLPIPFNNEEISYVKIAYNLLLKGREINISKFILNYTNWINYKDNFVKYHKRYLNAINLIGIRICSKYNIPLKDIWIDKILQYLIVNYTSSFPLRKRKRSISEI